MDAKAVEASPPPPPPSSSSPSDAMSVTTASASDALPPENAPPPPVNAAAASASAASLLSSSSAMTPTTTNYAQLNAQLAKSTGTLTPLGEDKVSSGSAATQKAKQSKKKAPADGDHAAKKPSPRVRVKNDANKPEKRKASPARNNAGSATPTAGSTPHAQMNGGPPHGAPPNQQYGHMGENPAGLPQDGVPPAQDTELRKHFLQRIYRQLQMTHRNQDDSVVRRLATNIEIDICRRAPTRSDYVGLMTQQINGLMQAELANGTVGLPSSVYVPGQAVATTSTGVGAPNSAGMMPPGAPTSSAPAFNQPSPVVSGPSDGGPRTSTPGQGSFMSLLSSQAPTQPFESLRAPNQYHQTAVPPIRPPQYAPAPNAQGYPSQGQVMPQPGVPRDIQGDPTNSHQQPYTTQRPQVQPNPMTAPPEFVAQFQRLERSALVDLLWTQHKTVIQYQRRLVQLETQLNSRQMAPGMTPTNGAAAPQGAPSGFYNSPNAQLPATSVSPSLSAEAEVQRARDRMNSRAQHSAGQYAHPQNPSTQPAIVPNGGVSPAMYWDRIRRLKDAYLQPLYIAHQALSQHSAPANSSQGTKAENVKHNISLACSILTEAPSSGQMRPVEVLDSIEKFIVSTVVPIVRRVNHPGPMHSTPTTPDNVNGQYARSQPGHGDIQDPSRQAMSTQTVPGSAAPPASLAFGIPSGAQSVPAAPAPSAANAKPAAKSTPKVSKSSGKKSPANGTKKAATPKTAASKSAPKGGKKSPGKANGQKQALTPTLPASTDNVKIESDASKTADASEATPQTQATQAAENPAKEPEPDHLPTKTDDMGDEDLNDFSDFADLDFDDDLQDPLTKTSNKENSSEVNPRKRSIEDV